MNAGPENTLGGVGGKQGGAEVPRDLVSREAGAEPPGTTERLGRRQLRVGEWAISEMSKSHWRAAWAVLWLLPPEL